MTDLLLIIWACGGLPTLWLLYHLESHGKLAAQPDVVDLTLFAISWPVTLAFLAVEWLFERPEEP